LAWIGGIEVVYSIYEIVLLAGVLDHVADLLNARVDGWLRDVLEIVYHISSLLVSLLQALEEETLPL
jgi:hypothetical protein